MVRTLAKRIVSRFHLPYFSFTPTFSVCPVHGYIAGEHGLCPHPHSDEELEIYGEVLDCTEPLPEGSYRTLADERQTVKQGSLFLNMDKVEL